MSEYTPSTMSIRDVWSFARAAGVYGVDPEQSDAEFDRWLAEHDAEVRAAVLEEAANSYPGSPSHPTVKWLRNRIAQG